MNGLLVSLGSAALAKGGEVLVKKITTAVKDKVKDTALGKIFTAFQGVELDLKPKLVDGSGDYRGREHFDWSKTEGDGGIWHRGRYLSGEMLDNKLKEQQLPGGSNVHNKISLADFEKLLDEIPEGKKEAENKGFLRVLYKDDKVVLDKVGSWGLGSAVINFRCNLTAEHNRQVRYLFADTIIEDMHSIFPDEDTHGVVTNMSTLLARNEIGNHMNHVYAKLKGLLSTEEKPIKNASGKEDPKHKASVVAQKLRRAEVAEVMAEYNKIFEEGSIKSVFDDLICDACDALGIEKVDTGDKAADNNARVKAFIEKYHDELAGAFGEDGYEGMIRALSAAKSGKAIGAQINKVAGELLKLCRKEAIEKEIANLKAGADGIRFASNSFAYEALQQSLLNTAQGVIGAMKGDGERPNVYEVVKHFTDDVMPYILHKCTEDPAFRQNLRADTFTSLLTEFIGDLGAIHHGGNFSSPTTKGQIFNEMLRAEIKFEEAELKNVEQELNTPTARQNDQWRAQLDAKQMELESGIEKMKDGLVLAKMVSEGKLPEKLGSETLEKWIGALDDQKREAMKKYLSDGVKGLQSEAYHQWLDNRWAANRLQVELPFKKDITDVWTDVIGGFDDKFIHALAANEAQKGDDKLQDFITRIGETMMGPAFVGDIGKRMHIFNANIQQLEGGSKVVGESKDVTQQNKNEFVARLVESFVKAALEIKVKNADEKMSKLGDRAQERAIVIQEKLGKVCKNLTSGWGSSLLNQFQRALESYGNRGWLTTEEVKVHMGKFRLELAEEIRANLLKAFAADLTDVLMIEDEKDFKAALDSRLAQYQQRTEQACRDKANAVIYGVMGFTLDGAKIEGESKDKLVRFEGAELVGKGYSDLDAKLYSEILSKGASNVLSADEMKAALTNFSQRTWVNLIVENAPGRGNLFTEFVASTAKQAKESIKSKILNLINKKQADIPKIIQKIVGFEDIQIVKDVKGAFSENIEKGTIEEKWVKARQTEFSLLIGDRLANYQAFEKKFLTQCKNAILGKLETLKKNSGFEMLANLKPDALAALADDVQKQFLAGEGALKDVFKQVLAHPEMANADIALTLLVDKTMKKFSDSDYNSALSNIRQTKRAELQALVGQEGELAKRIEDSLTSAVYESFKVKSAAEVAEMTSGAGELIALTQSKGMLLKMAKWISVRIQSDIQTNPLLVYGNLVAKEDGLLGADPNSTAAVFGRICNKHVEDFKSNLKGLRELTEKYVATFPKENEGTAYLWLRTLFGAEFEPNIPTRGEVSVCFEPYKTRLAEMTGRNLDKFQKMQDLIQAECAKREKLFNATFTSYVHEDDHGFDAYRNKSIAAIRNAAAGVSGRVIADVVKDDLGILNLGGFDKHVTDAAHHAVEVAYQDACGTDFSRYASVSRTLSSFLQKGATQDGLLAEIREKFKNDGSRTFLKFVDSPRSVNDHWLNWFTDQCLQRAVEYVLKEKNQNIARFADELDFDGNEPISRQIHDLVLDGVEELLNNDNLIPLSKGFYDLGHAYGEALKAHSEIKLSEQSQVPVGNFKDALLNLLDCHMPLSKKDAKRYDGVVENYVKTVRSASDNVVQKLFDGFKETYNKHYDGQIETIRVLVGDSPLADDMVTLFKSHCAKMLGELVGWATYEVINGASVEAMTKQLNGYFEHDFAKTASELAVFLDVTNMRQDPKSLDALLGLGGKPELIAKAQEDPTLARLIASTQKQAWKNILSGFEYAMSQKMSYSKGVIDLLSGHAILPIGADPSSRHNKISDNKNPQYWITEGASVWEKLTNRKLAAINSAYPATPSLEIEAKEVESIVDTLNQANALLEKMETQFFDRHPTFVDEVLQTTVPGKGSPPFPQFYTLARTLNPQKIGSGNSVKMSVGDLLALHQSLLLKVSKSKVSRALRKELPGMKGHYDNLKSLWKPYGNRIEKAMGTDDPENRKQSVKFGGKDGRCTLLVPDTEIKGLYANVSAEPDDFQESLAFNALGRPNPDLVTLVQDVARDILTMHQVLN